MSYAEIVAILIWGFAALIFALVSLVNAVGAQRVALTRAERAQDPTLSPLGHVVAKLERRIEALENPPIAIEQARQSGFAMMGGSLGDFLYPWTSKPESRYPIATHPKLCDACRSTMVLRLRHKTEDIREWFWGCSNPQCRNSRNAETCGFDQQHVCLATHPLGSVGFCLGRGVRGSRGPNRGEYGDVLVCQTCARWSPLA